MNMNRREFVRFIAVLAAAGSSSPEIIDTLERYYDVNTPSTNTGLAAVDEIILAGQTSRSHPMRFILSLNEGIVKDIGLNTLASFRWAAMPDQKIVGEIAGFRWAMSCAAVRDAEWTKEFVAGQVSYIGQDGIRRYIPIARMRLTA